MKQYKSSAELKACAKESLMGKYNVAITSSILYLLFIFLADEFTLLFQIFPGVVGKVLYYVSILLVTIFTGFFAYGFALIFLKIACNIPAKISDLFQGFSSHPKKILAVQTFRALITFVFCIPVYLFNELSDADSLQNYIGLYFVLYGIALLGQFLVMLYYNQVFFVMLDFPKYDAKKALAFSRKLMKGRKASFIYLMVSFIPLFLLGMLTCCIGFLWLIPYIQAVLSWFYLDIVKNNRS